LQLLAGTGFARASTSPRQRSLRISDTALRLFLPILQEQVSNPKNRDMNTIHALIARPVPTWLAAFTLFIESRTRASAARAQQAAGQGNFA
jgi:hypothetical protein